MSRRRSLQNETGLLARPHAKKPKKGVFPAGRRVSVILVDIGDHALVRFIRYFDDLDPDWYRWDRGSVGENLIWLEVLDDAGAVVGYAFACKGCRDQGLPWQTVIPRSDIATELHRLWIEEAQSAVPTPRTTRLRVSVDPAAPM